MRFPKRAAILITLVVVLLLVGTTGFHVIEGWSWFDSFYTTLMTVSTIGAEPENRLSHEGKVFNVIVIFLGLVLVGFAVGTLTRAVIEFELGEFFGRRRMEKEITRLKDHIIICGVGRVGRRIAMEVRARHLPLVIIESDPIRAEWAQKNNFPVIIGDASKEEFLRQAHIEFARGLASAVTSDAQNVYIVLTARSLAPKIPIIARASEEDAESKLAKAGATAVISPYSYAGQRMARMLTRPHVQRFLDLAFSSLADEKLDLQIEEMEVGEASRLSGARLGDTDIRERMGVIVLAIRHKTGQLEFNPGSDARISSGDFVIVMGDSKKLKELESLVVASSSEVGS